MIKDNPLYVVTAFIDALYQAGVTTFCISPGSRSTPLTVAVARHPKLRSFTLLDERSAAFFALGQARVLQQTVALICTSGTATANYLPAIMEASLSRIPLLVITADRPPELIGIGSPQTVDQTKLYGTHVKASFTMPTPDGNPALLAHVLQTATRLVGLAQSEPKGPVAVNFPFREPLLPPLAQDEQYPTVPSILSSYSTAGEATITTIANWIDQETDGLILCGPMDDQETAWAIRRLAEKTGYPILADPLSQQRVLGDTPSLVIDGYDLFLRDTALYASLKPKVLLSFGHTPTSKALALFLAHFRHDFRHVVFDTHHAHWINPWFTATEVVFADPKETCERLCRQVMDRSLTDNVYTKRWQVANEAIDRLRQTLLEKYPADFEGGVALVLSQVLPQGSALFVGNSMPIRDVDSFFAKTNRTFQFYGNRGVSGIDGITSTALGIAASYDGPVVLLLGDVSFYHDLTGLLIAHRYALSLTIVLVDNDGGGIFTMLSQANEPDVLDYFTTSHGTAFEGIVQGFHARYHQVSSLADLAYALVAATNRDGVDVLHLRFDKNRNAMIHEEIKQQCLAVTKG